jgi:xanthine dehydrogenase YagS FAD-binding subunit
MFEYLRPATADEALARLADHGASPLGGGTDLLVGIEERLSAPKLLVDLRGLDGWRGFSTAEDGGLRIGAAAHLHEIAAHPEVRHRWPALAESCDVVGTTALRNMGTLGGNLCQRPRCWYLRRSIPCLKNGGTDCPARDGENQYHAILEGGPCFIVHPSDPAVALTALEAIVEIESRSGTRRIPISDLYLLPSRRLDSETILAQGEVIRAVVLPASSAGGTQHYRKLMQRAAWDFALVSLAATRRVDGDVRLVLGGVAPRPYRINSSVEEDVSVGGLDDETISTLAERALYDAAPLRHNGYKVALAASLLRDAIRSLAAEMR